ncbi:MAG: 3-phosphoshikimate 1-carboxyvinyltransferase [Syntrophomonadaceae bacterium]|nr:3-phosphoshikimate 1-carboxyvinyltransferase [Syntrophomonadaceae bacterium]
MQQRINPVKALSGDIEVSADKSISHRSAMFAALAQSESRIKNYLLAEDTLSTCRCMEQLGVKIVRDNNNFIINSPGIEGLMEPAAVLDCGNSGTSMRLMSGLLAGRSFNSILSGDESLSNRPMRRIIEPLTSMGAHIWGRENNSKPPLAIQGSKLRGGKFNMSVASAQVKSALLLAGLQADNPTVIIEPHRSRDHSERMLQDMGAELRIEDNQITLIPGKSLSVCDWSVPGDISSAAFFLVAATIVPDSELRIRQVGINPTRTGIIQALTKMGANIKIENNTIIAGEPVADLIIKSAQLKGITVNKEMIPEMIDEIPVLAVAMAMSQGESVVQGANELRVKETDRIQAISTELRKMGVDITELEDGFVVQGNPEGLKAAQVFSYGDHRIAMSLAVAALVADKTTEILSSEAVNISFPEFWGIMESIIA